MTEAQKRARCRRRNDRRTLMIAELGLAALWLAAALAALQLVAGALVLRKDDPALAAIVRPVAVCRACSPRLPSGRCCCCSCGPISR